MFYGNITNTTHTAWQFDKIYSSRYSMDQNMRNDGIAPGRFVLVQYSFDPNFDSDQEYDSTQFLPDFKPGYVKWQDQTHIPEEVNENSTFVVYLDANCIIPYEYTDFIEVNDPIASDISSYWIKRQGFYFKTSTFIEGETYYIMSSTTATAHTNAVTTGTIIRRRHNILQEGTINPTPLHYTEDYFICTGHNVLVNPDLAEWKLLHREDVDDNRYFINFDIDKSYYYDKDDNWGALTRGYDATVWEKVLAEGSERYVLVARLNAMAAGVAVIPEPPGNGNAYIGTDSTEDVYKVHMPSSWEIGIKEGPPSDDPIPEEGSEGSQKAIYFNKAGFSEEYQNYSDQNDFISFEPNISKDYNKKYPHLAALTSDKKAPDIQELTICLPSIGNAVSNMYDKMYGTIESDQQILRPLDTKWYTPSDGDKRTEGDIAVYKGGKTYDLSTLAGTINTLHNRLGQIIEEIKTDNLPTSLEVEALWDDDKIYYLTKKDQFYYKGTNYTYTDLEFYYEPIALTIDTWEYGIYYIYNINGAIVGNLEDGSPVRLDEDTNYNFRSDVQYYQKLLKNGDNIFYQLIELIQYEPSQYYRKIGTSYYRDNNLLAPTTYNQRYVDITLADETHMFEYAYQPNRYYKSDYNGNYIVATEPEANYGVDYLNITGQRVNFFDQLNSVGFIYRPNVYYYYEDEGLPEVTVPVELRLATELIPDPYRNYYYLELSKYPEGMLDINGNPIVGYQIERKIDVAFDPTHNEKTVYWMDANSNYWLVTTEFLKKQNTSFFELPGQVFYTLDIKTLSGEMFRPDTYYYMDDITGDLHLGTNETFVPGRVYYEITQVTPIPDFYKPNTYYWQANEDAIHILDTSERMRTTGKYFKKGSLYVTNDQLGECPFGYEWNPEVKVIPWPLTVQLRESQAAAIELTGLSNGEHSLHGLILALARLTEIGDESTRNKDSVQGILNSAADCFYTIGTLRPNHLLYVNKYGRISSSPLTHNDLLAMYNKVNP